MAGTLFVVATPIGNLEDLTFRARRILGEVDLIAAEDTRRTAKLLAHYGISRPTVSLREHNEVRETPRLIARLQAGEQIALVSDAGTPGIADPGAGLVRAARDRGIAVVPIPGPSAVAAALSVSGFPADQFVFMGFVPRSGESRNSWFDRLEMEPSTVVAFEAPHRIRRTLDEIAVKLGERPILIARELTKVFEELVESPITRPGDRANDLFEQGEFVLVIAPQAEPPKSDVDPKLVADACQALAGVEDIGPERAVGLTARAFGLPDRVVRKAVKQARIEARRRDEREARDRES